MQVFLYIIQAIQEHFFFQHFLSAFFGSLSFDIYLYFNDDISRLAHKRKEDHPNKTAVYYVFKSINHAFLGGVIAIKVDQSNWISFVVGFLSSNLIGFLVRILLLNSTKQAFWITVGKVFYIIIGEPMKKLVSVLEVFNTRDKER